MLWLISMNKVFLALLIFLGSTLFITACNSSTPNTSTQPFITPTGMLVEASKTAQSFSSGTLTLVLISPQDNSEVSVPQVELLGSISENAVLSINDQIYLLDAGNFSQQIPLEAGANVLQIVVSDDAGNEIDLVLTVTYSTD